MDDCRPVTAFSLLWCAIGTPNIVCRVEAFFKKMFYVITIFIVFLIGFLTFIRIDYRHKRRIKRRKEHEKYYAPQSFCTC
jgi:hypothetical protein